MDNTHKLLLALIDALGYEVEEDYFPVADLAISKWNNLGRVGDKPQATIDYKVTKKEINNLGVIGWNDMTNIERIAILNEKIKELSSDENNN